EVAVFAKVVAPLGIVAACKASAIVVVVGWVIHFIASVRFVITHGGVPLKAFSSTIATAYIMPEFLVIPVRARPGIARTAQVIVIAVAVVGAGVVVPVGVAVVVRHIAHAIGVILAAALA